MPVKELIDLATRSRYVLDLLQHPVDLNLNTLHWEYAGSMLRFAPLAVDTVGNAPAYLRRNQKDVLSELPGMIEHRDWVELSPADADAYRNAVAEGNFALMRRVAWVSDTSAKLERFDEIVEEARANGRKVLVFSFFIDVLENCTRTWARSPWV